MAIQRFNYSKPANYQGLEDLAPAEVQSFALEMIRRLDQNLTSLENAIRDQVIVDPSVLPPQESGDSPAETFNSATMQDVEDRELEAIFWSV